jgi:hypothetical protein
MSGRNKRRAQHHSDSSAQTLDPTDADAMVNAQQRSMTEPEARGYLGTMTQEQKEALDAAQTAASNHKSDKQYRPTVAAPMLGRDPNADTDALDDDDDAARMGNASRVGFRTVQHPRARTADALHDALGDTDGSDLTVDELAGLTDRAGLTVEGTGATGSVLKSDLLQAIAGVRAEFPRAPAA